MGEGELDDAVVTTANSGSAASGAMERFGTRPVRRQWRRNQRQRSDGWAEWRCWPAIARLSWAYGGNAFIGYLIRAHSTPLCSKTDVLIQWLLQCCSRKMSIPKSHIPCKPTPMPLASLLQNCH